MMKKAYIAILLFIFLILVGSVWWISGLSAANSSDKTSKIFVVRKGEGVREIASSLKKERLIKSSVVFFILIWQQGLDRKIQAGDFRLSPSMTAQEIANNLTHGTLDIWVTVKEGVRAEEIDEILKDKIPSYKPFWKGKLVEKEGYLFPDTYLIPRDADIDLVLSVFKRNFDAKFSKVQLRSDLSGNDLVILSSLVEREARSANARTTVASILLKRLKIGMALGADATVQYALGYQTDEKSWWKKNLTFEDLKVASPYNTYLNLGLPPTPICNPSLLALQAVSKADPSTPYLYYFHDKAGNSHYATTLEEHNANVKKYSF